MKNGVCPKCQAANVIPNVVLRDTFQTASELVGRLDEPAPDNFFQLRKQISVLRAWICGTCGYTEIYAADPTQLARAYDQGYR